ncbi:hypothetical protein GDO81_007050 [Engystomops pustulosus]|uniref:Retinitis pigmentosa 1-like 1 protein n=1 Tax=Engystomops pustulosus TaxID=76066 RepID=A0AAV7C6D2_ENGPU|nr:hypothetical protein GDO81_007050 [Engystomops pustulosus]KAG8579968.1 hypothetical protein GDO81_007050 [Engystomops pustulosus]
MRRSVTDKLPGLRSLSSNNTEVMDNKKNANFGLKAKKSVIHPRPSSSNKTRLSFSSEKSYPNGLNMSPVNSGFGSYPNMCPHGKSDDTGHSLLNDDIEKKVHVNKDGSLSVEMKVRFRLLNEETLQWSTQIKKSSLIGKKCEKLCLFDENDKKEEMNMENYSETDESFYPCDADSYSSKLNDVGPEDMYCSHCGMQCPEYDIWKNPMHANQQEDYVKRATWQTQSSTSSTSSRHRVMCDQKTSIDSLHSMSSEEYTEHIMHRSSHYSETKENGDTMVTYSTVSQCASRSGRSTVASNIDGISDTEQAKRGKSQNRSRSSLKSQCSIQKQQSQLSEELHSHRSHGGSYEECPCPSPSPSSDRENCSQRVSVVSQTSLRSRKSKMLKRNSTNTKSLASNRSYDEEETPQTSRNESLKNTQSMSRGNSEDPGGGELVEVIKNSHDNDLHDANTEDPSLTDPMKSIFHDYDKRSTGRSSTKSKSSSKKSLKVNGQDEDEILRDSPCLSSMSKQSSDNKLIHEESIDHCEEKAKENKAILSKSQRKSMTEHQGQSFQSTKSQQSLSSVPESEQPNCVQDEQPVLNHQESCNESLNFIQKSDRIACTINDDDDEHSLPISRASSSKFNGASCRGNEPVFSVSSRVSSISEKKSLAKSTSEKCDQNSSHSSKEMSQEEEMVSDNVTAALDTNSIHSPSPPEGKPIHKHTRLAQFKLASTSISSDQIKTMNGEKTGNSRTSTPASKTILDSKASTETCKRTKTAATSHNSTDDIHSTKKRKNSSSSSKRKQKGESLDADRNVNSELVPSALPNVTPEEVVNEWLRKIPSQTMVVEYEVEECQKKTRAEIGLEASKTETYKEKEEGDLLEEAVKVENNADKSKEELSEDVQCVNPVNDIQDINIPNGKDNKESSREATNNIKNDVVQKETARDKKSLPNSIQTSVQIMKALLSPSQESKFDRSNSLPEVSRTMGRKLSNSATVLISCLASLQLLDEGQKEITKNTNDLKKPKYIELLNILQALWTEGPTNKSITNIKSGKHYSRDDELTPVSSSGVDINSGFDGSGDGSVTGGVDHVVVIGKPEEGKISVVTKEVESSIKKVVSDEHNVDNGQETMSEVNATGVRKVKSCIMDENMNEKKIDSSVDTVEEELKQETIVEGHYNLVNNVNDVECIETLEEHKMSNNDNMNILSHSEEPKSNESNSPETNNINSPSEGQSTFISTSESNGKNEDKQGNDVNPVWVLKLLKKIEEEFITHYVDAMNEFKVRWNLEDNENLDEMITELKNEVSQRIQRSISNELKRLKAHPGTMVPRPPVEGSRRRSSLQADERRRRLQTMHRVSIHRYATGVNGGVGSNDISSDTDEEDLTFSASFGDDSSGQPNDDFCPCEKCIQQKRALKSSKPQAVLANAPIIKAFDLQQILKLKRENDELKIDVVDSTPILEEECNEDIANKVYNSLAANKEASSDAGEETDGEILDTLREDVETNIEEVKSAKDECEGCDSSDFIALQENENEQSDSKEPDEELKPTQEDLENSNSHASEKECPDENTSVCEENEDDEPTDQHIASNEEEVNGTEENEAEPSMRDEVHVTTDQFSEDEDHFVENETAQPVIDTAEDVQEEDTQDLEMNDSNLHKPCLGQASLITQNGSVEDAEKECKENHNVGETSPNGESNSSGSKKSQMYPDSSSDEDEDGDSPRNSPVGLPKNKTTLQMYANNKESLEECDDKSKKTTDEDAIDQDDFDF